MKLERPTKINLQAEAVANSKARGLRCSFASSVQISTRDARAHHQLAGLRPGDSRHIASMGELSLHDVADAVVSRYGPFDCLTLATWAASEEAIKRLVALRQSGGVKRIEALVDSRCPVDCAEAHALMSSAFDLYKTAGNHAKIMAFTGATSPGIAIESTANLTRNPRCEVLAIHLNTELADFHRDWIREVLNAA